MSWTAFEKNMERRPFSVLYHTQMQERLSIEANSLVATMQNDD